MRLLRPRGDAPGDHDEYETADSGLPLPLGCDATTHRLATVAANAG